MEMITDWSRLAACRDGDPDALFVQGAEQNVAKRVCRGCPVRPDCLADVLGWEASGRRHGIVAGLTPTQRARLAAQQRSEGAAA